MFSQSKGSKYLVFQRNFRLDDQLQTQRISCLNRGKSESGNNNKQEYLGIRMKGLLNSHFLQKHKADKNLVKR